MRRSKTTLKCRRCKKYYESYNHASKLCLECRATYQPRSTKAEIIKATLKHIISSTIQLPYNQGYLQALVDFGHMEKTTLDEIYALAKKENG